MRDVQGTALLPKIKDLLYGLPYSGPAKGSVALGVHRRKQFTNRPMEPVPTDWSSSAQLSAYIAQITRYHHVDRAVSGSGGQVNQILKELVSHSHPKSRQYLTVDIYNAAIEHFLRYNNIRAARELYADMRDNGYFVRPNTTTYNLLMVPARQAQIERSNAWVVHPLKSVALQLARMRERSVAADSETWNIVLSSVMDPGQKSRVMEEMRRRGIALSQRSLAICIKDVVQASSSEFVMAYLHQQPDETLANLGSDSVSLVLGKLLDEQKYELAWQFVQYACDKWAIRFNKPLFNTFARCFAEKGRVDWIFGLVGAAQRMAQQQSTNQSTFYEVDRPNRVTYEYMIEALARAPFHPNAVHAYNAVVGQFPGFLTHNKSTPRFKYWTRILRAKVDWYNAQLAKHEQTSATTLVMNSGADAVASDNQLWNESVNRLAWPKETPILDYSEDAGRAAAAYALGVVCDSSKTVDLSHVREVKNMQSWGYFRRGAERSSELW